MVHAPENMYIYFSLNPANNNLRSSILGFFVVISEGMEVVIVSPDSLKVAEITYSTMYFFLNSRSFNKEYWVLLIKN